MADSITVFGIYNCDTVKKARKWLDAQSVSYDFHDYKKKGIDEDTLNSWCKELGWEALVNRRGTTWRKLDDAQKADLNQASAVKLMQENTSLIKRPVVQVKNKLILGFNAEQYETTLL
jgi:arsenate reductase